MAKITAYIDIEGRDKVLIKKMFQRLKNELAMKGGVSFPNASGDCILSQIEFIGDAIYIDCEATDSLFLKGLSKAFYNVRFSVEAVIENTKAVISNYFNGNVSTYNSYMV